jgi:lysophospholipase L1-like esterase
MRLISIAVTCAALAAAVWATDLAGRAGARVFPGNQVLQPRYDDNPVAVDIASAYPTRHADVVMLGDSITDAAEWTELLPGVDVVNRGLPGDSVSGMLARVGTVTTLTPGRVVIMAGINDLNRSRSPSDILVDYRKLILALQSSGAKVTIQSTLYVGHDRGWLGVQRFRNYRRNSSVAELNEGLRMLAAETGADYLDLNAVLAPKGEMPEELTIDGVHVAPEGYRLWATTLRQTLSADIAQGRGT